MKRLVQLLVLVTPLILTTAAQAQQPAGGRGGRGAPPEPPKNLQILPKDIARPELIATMGGFARGLGVQCSYCHVRPRRTAGKTWRKTTRRRRKPSIRRTRTRSASSIS